MCQVGRVDVCIGVRVGGSGWMSVGVDECSNRTVCECVGVCMGTCVPGYMCVGVCNGSCATEVCV